MTESYCSYEISKLLKKKGFDEYCMSFWEYELYEYSLYIVDYPISNSELEKELVDGCSAPTHQMVCAWLREKHNILISIIPQEVKVGVDKLCYAIYRITEDVYTPLYNGYINNLVDYYEDIVEAALKYCLENLI